MTTSLILDKLSYLSFNRHQSELLFKESLIAAVGHTALHFPHRIHSKLLAFFTGSHPILQTFAQAPQLTHFSESTR